jgi:hypothetical protein
MACKWSANSNTGQVQTTPTTTASTPETPSLDGEAAAAVRDLWEQHTTKCGDSYYSIGGGLEPETIHQYKDVSFDVRSQSLTEANRLNGIEWNGRVAIKARLLRDNRDGVWQEWRQNQSGGYDIGATKRQSGWSVLQLLHVTQQRKIDCAQVTS